MAKNRIPRKMKKAMKSARLQRPSMQELKKFVSESRVRVGDSVTIGKGKTVWTVDTGYTDSLVLRSAAGATRKIPRDQIDTLTLV